MDDEIFSGEGGDPPNAKPMRRRRTRKLSGPAAAALGELAFKMYEVARSDLPDAQKWRLLSAKLLAWRAAFLP